MSKTKPAFSFVRRLQIFAAHKLAAMLILSVVISLHPCIASPETTGIQSLLVSRNFFNPALNQQVDISFQTDRGGILSVHVMDGNNNPIRALVANKRVETGKFSLAWDGRDEKESIVPDDAYTFRILLNSSSEVGQTALSLAPVKEFPVNSNYYDRQSRVLSYNLSKPARVLIQAGTTGQDPVTKQPSRKLQKTIANHVPRIAGPVIEFWDGFDENGIYIGDLPNLFVLITAVDLPENCVITIGQN